MLPASNRGVGGNVCGPDVCNTPTPPTTTPIPYPNVAMNAQATPFSTIVRVSYVNALNMGSSIPMSSGDEPGVDAALLRAEASEELHKELNNLDDTTREMILLRYFGEMSFKDLAEHFQCPLGTVLARVHRGLKSLRKKLVSDDEGS